VLRRLARQRVALVLQPGNVWVIEKTVKDNNEADVALKTCYLRGWVEPIENAVPRGQLTADGKIPDITHPFNKTGPIYRVTDAGWSVVNRSQIWLLTTVGLTALTLLATVIAILVAQRCGN
jgi:hypothetical protein